MLEKIQHLDFMSQILTKESKNIIFEVPQKPEPP